MINKLRNYLINVRLELAKVSWPTFPELISSTNVVIVVTTLFAIFLLVVDRILTQLMQFIIG
jgi:preprotein translocase subunit SecE